MNPRMLGHQAQVSKIEDWKGEFFNDHGGKGPKVKDINSRLGRIATGEQFKSLSTEVKNKVNTIWPRHDQKSGVEVSGDARLRNICNNYLGG